MSIGCFDASAPAALFEYYRKFAVFAVFALYEYLSAEAVYYRLADIEPEPYARLVESAALVALVESVEYIGQIRLGYTDSFVIYGNGYIFAVVLYRDAEFAALAGEFNAVITDIVEHLINSILIGISHERIGRIKIYIQFLFIYFRFKRNQYQTRHFAYVEIRLCELAVARLYSRNVEK